MSDMLGNIKKVSVKPVNKQLSSSLQYRVSYRWEVI